MTDRASKLKGLVWVAITCLLGVAFAFGISPVVRAIPWNWEISLSHLFSSDLPSQPCRQNAQAESLLNRLVKRIYPLDHEDTLFSIDVQVIHNPVINAYAALGGKISVNSGLLKQAESPEEFAGVLSHEIGHVQRRHILEGAIIHIFTTQGIDMIFSGGTSSTADWTEYFLRMNFTRSQEAEADEAGLRRLQKAHVDNQGFKHFFERMEKSESLSTFISDHPSNGARMEMVDTFDNQGVTPIMTPEEWQVLKNYCQP